MSNYFDKYVYVSEAPVQNPGPYSIQLSLADAAAQHTQPAAKSINTFATPLVNPQSKKVRGLRPRFLRLVLFTGSTPNIETRYKILPVLLAADFLWYIANPMTAVTINGVAWTITDFIQEDTYI